MKKNLLSIFFFSIFVFLGCGNLKENKITIDFWAMGAEGETVQKLIPQFEKENPGIKVNVQMIPWTAAQEKLISAYASDNMPDAWQLGNTWIPQFVQLNAVENLDGYIKKSNNIKKENYFSGIWNTNIIDSSVYGIPWYIDTRILFYRTDIFHAAGYDSPPKTWHELLDISRKIVGLKLADYAIYLPTNEWNVPVIFGLQNGANLLKNNNTYGNFSGKKFKQAFDFLLKFYKENLSPAGIQKVPNVYQAFKNKYIAMYISGPWNIPEFKKWMKGDLSGKWMTAPLPGPNDSTKGLSLAGGASLVIYKESKNKNEAWKFIEYLSKPKVQFEFYKILSDLPAVKKAWENHELKEDKFTKAFYEQFQNVVAAPKITEWEQIVFSKLQQYLEFAARGALTSDEALASLDNDVNKILEKRRWILNKR